MVQRSVLNRQLEFSLLWQSIKMKYSVRNYRRVRALTEPMVQRDYTLPKQAKRKVFLAWGQPARPPECLSAIFLAR